MAKLVLKKFTYKYHVMRQTMKYAKSSTLEQYAALTATIARRSMRPAPSGGKKRKRRKQRTRFGRYVAIQSGKRKGRMRFEKGMHSPPGKPPYYNKAYTGINLRDIIWDVHRDQGFVDIYTQGQKGKPNRAGVIRAPILHEAGGVTRIIRFYNRRTKQAILSSQSFRYPKRAFLEPAGMKATRILRRNMQKNFRRIGAGPGIKGTFRARRAA